MFVFAVVVSSAAGVSVETFDVDGILRLANKFVLGLGVSSGPEL